MLNPLHSFVLHVSFRRSKVTNVDLLFRPAEPSSAARLQRKDHKFRFSSACSRTGKGFPAPEDTGAVVLQQTYVDGANISTARDGNRTGYHTRASTHLQLSQQPL